MRLEPVHFSPQQWQFYAPESAVISLCLPLSAVQNAAARLVMGLSPRARVRPELQELYWLPVLFRIEFKVGLLMFPIHTMQCPACISEAMASVSCRPSQPRLRSSGGTNCTRQGLVRERSRSLALLSRTLWCLRLCACRPLKIIIQLIQLTKRHFAELQMRWEELVRRNKRPTVVCRVDCRDS